MSLKQAVCDKLTDPVSLEAIRKLKTSRNSSIHTQRQIYVEKEEVISAIPSFLAHQRQLVKKIFTGASKRLQEVQQHKSLKLSLRQQEK